MNKGEIESVMAHEVWHIKNNDVLIQSVASVASQILRLTVIFIPLAVLILRMSMAESREYRADYYGTRLSGKPKDMASALKKINETVRANPMESSPAYEGLWIVNPFKRDGLTGMFSTHPPSARRIKRVDDMYHEGMPEIPEATEVD